MLSINKILCPTDFSEFSDRALVHAIDLSARLMAELYVHHALGDRFIAAPDMYMASADFQTIRASYEQDIAEELSKRLAPGVRYTKILTRGRPSEDILQVAQEQKIDLIVMGTHGRKGLSRLMLGSVTEQVVKRASCPVLTICHLADEPERPIVFRRVLVPIDFSDDALRGLEYAMSLAEDYSAELYPLHVVERRAMAEPIGMPSGSDFYARQSLAAVQEKLAHQIPESIRQRCPVKELVRTGNAHEEIVQTAREIGADLIVMGVVGHGALELALFGSTTYQVMRDAPCPVLTVRATPSKA